MKVLIIDDERRSINRLAKMIETYDPTIEIIGRIDSIKKTLLWFETNTSPELIFMDIQLADGECFDIFEETKITAPVIFTTAYDQYAIKAFKVNSIDYLLKPFSYSDLEAAMNKFTSFRKSAPSLPPQTDVLKNVSKSYKGRFLVKSGMHIYSILVGSIKCFFSNDKVTYLCTLDNKKYIIDDSLDQLEGLISPELFFRINRKYIVNINYITNIGIHDGRLRVVLEDYKEDEHIYVSRDKVQEFKNVLNK